MCWHRKRPGRQRTLLCSALGCSSCRPVQREGGRTGWVSYLLLLAVDALHESDAGQETATCIGKDGVQEAAPVGGEQVCSAEGIHDGGRTLDMGLQREAEWCTVAAPPPHGSGVSPRR